MYVPFLIEDFVISNWTLTCCLWGVLDNLERTRSWHFGTGRKRYSLYIGCEYHPRPLGSQSEICLLNREALLLSCSAKSEYFKEIGEWFCLKFTMHLYRGWEFQSTAQVLLYGEVLFSLFFQSWKRRRKKCIGAQICKICGPEWQAKSYTASCGKISAIRSQKSDLQASCSKICDVLSSHPRKSGKCSLKI